jgi:phosphoglycolate phosphatase
MNILIFDYDGVIVDSLDVFMDKTILACKNNGSNQVNNKVDFLELFDGNLYDKLIEKGIPKQNITKLMNEFNIDPKEQELIRPFKGIENMLKILSRKNKLFIITSNLTNIIKNSLKNNNIEFFEKVLGADIHTSKVKKIEKIKARYKDENIFYIGDTKGDMIEGKKAKVKTIAVTWGWHSKDKLARQNPDYIVDSPDDLIKLFY